MGTGPEPGAKRGLDTLRHFDKYGNMKTNEVVRALAALAQDTRLAIFRLLVEAGPTGLAAGEIASALKATPATLSFHLKELSHAGLVESRQVGRFVYYSAHYDHMTRLLAFLSENCCAREGACRSACGPSTSDSPARRASRGTHKTKESP